RVAREFELDPESASAEWGGEFRLQSSAWLTRGVIERAVMAGVPSRPPVRARYWAFADVASGAGRDSAALAIGHLEGQRLIVDMVDEVKPPFSAEEMVRRFSTAIKQYGICRVGGDAFAKGWCAESFGRNGVTYHEDAPPK